MEKIPWQIVKSRYIVDDRWIKLRADDCLTSDGKSVSPYYVLEYPPWVNVVALSPDENIVVLRQYCHGICQFILEIPGGAVCLGPNFGQRIVGVSLHNVKIVKKEK